MGQTLTHGVYLPAEGERNCYDGLASNWNILDGAVGTIAEHTSALAGKAPAVHTHVTSDVTDLLNSDHTWTGNQTYSGLTKTSGKAEHKAAIGADLDDFILNMETYNWGTDQVNTPESYGSLLVLNREGNTHSSPYEGWINQIGFGTTGKLYHRCKINVEGPWSVWRKIYTDWDNYIPGQNNTYDLGSSSYQWNNLYAKNYYYNGVAWGLDKANVWTGNQTYSGVLTLSSSSDVAEQFKQKLPKDVSTSNDAMACVNTLVDSAGHYVVIETLGHWANYVAKNTTLKYKNDSTKQGAIEFRLYSDGSGIFYAQAPFECDLGNSYNKWKSLNGVNPGALSLPDYTLAKVDLIDFSQWSVAGQPNEYTPISDGWLFVNIKDTASNSIFIYAYGLYNSDPTKATDYSVSCFGNGSQGVNGRIAVMIPVRAGIAYRVFIRAASVSEIWSAKFYPALGNV